MKPEIQYNSRVDFLNFIQLTLFGVVTCNIPNVPFYPINQLTF